MKSLRNRIAALLILAIVTVVALATFAASSILQPPIPLERVALAAREIRLVIALVETGRGNAIRAGAILRNGPAPGVEDKVMSDDLTRSLLATGQARDAIVTRSTENAVVVASVDLGGSGWLWLEVPDREPPPGGWIVLTGWIVLIVLGSTAVSIIAASKIIKPLELLESAAGRIGADGVLPYIPETGAGEVRATAQSLNRLSARLKTAMESRMRLVAAAGHDLRTPMTRMRLRAEFIAEEDERQKWLADLEELDTIADSAIRLVREEVRRDSPEIIRLDHLIYEIVDELEQLGLPVENSLLPVLNVSGAPIALKRAVRNLVINAATHGNGANIKISQEADRAVVMISDEGPGIPEDLMGRVFEPFFRVDTARRKTVAGAGLGLAIAKEIIERFGGTVSIENRQPAGLVQTVYLPLAMTGMY